jgi:tetratricopeptide (TPR) repeat protein/predicted aspartyl protease
MNSSAASASASLRGFRSGFAFVLTCRNDAMQTSAVSRSKWKTAGAFLALLIAAGNSAPALAKCELKKVAELPITMDGLRPTIEVQFNGKPANLVVDSGAFFSSISGATAAQYGLKLSPAPFGLHVQGIGGYADMSLTTVKDFGLIGVTIRNVEFLVGGSELGGAGLLGQNLLEKFDVEYDLAHGAIRLFKTDGCGKAMLAYWNTPGQAYSVVGINSIDPHNPHTTGDAYVNGKEIRVMFDTGAYTSVLSLKAAERAGVKLDSPGVMEAGFTRGLGRSAVKSYLARFDSFKIGDGEEIKNTRLRIGEIGLGESDMLLGADFFVSHRIFVSNREHKAFITYNGGPVFNLSKMPQSAAAAPSPQEPGTAGGASVPSDPAAAGVPDAAAPANGNAPANNAQASDAPTDAAGYARRGAGFAARRDFAPALADLSKACELTPDEPEYFFRRGLLYVQTGELPLALADLDHALQIRADFLPAYLPRAEIHLRQKDLAAANADFDNVDRLAPKQADLRFELANIYARQEKYSASIVQYDLWIDSHPDDVRLANALGGRCLASALQDQDLAQGLSDCSKALRRADKQYPEYGSLHADRGMLYLRQGNVDKALSDFNDALKLMPKNARALYGRGVAESRKHLAKESAADIEAARLIAPQLPERYQRYGIVP